MSFLSKLRPGASASNDTRPAASMGNDVEHAEPVTELSFMDKEQAIMAASAPDQDAQRGVQEMEAVTLVWTKKSLAALLILYD